MIGIFIHIMDGESNTIQEMVDIMYANFMNVLSRSHVIEIYCSLIM